MDAGLAAVLGALAGSVATIGAAMATGWAQREGARIAARAEHRRERREPRHAVYRDLIEAATTFQNLKGVYSFFDEEMPDEFHLSIEDANRLSPNQRAVEKRAVEVALAGPADVGETAMRLSKLTHELVTYVMALSHFTHGNGPPDDETRRYSIKQATGLSKAFDLALEELVSRAQKALDDDGSRK